MVKLTVRTDTSPARGSSVSEKQAVLRHAAIQKHAESLMDAGAELLPLVYDLKDADPVLRPEEYERLASALWKQLRLAWASWWPLRRLMEPEAAWSMWEKCCGTVDLWQRAQLDGLLDYWIRRKEGPEQLLPFEMAQLHNWLFGASWMMKHTAPSDPPKIPMRLLFEDQTPF